MRRLLVLAVLASLVLPVSADDAWMLPPGVLRITEGNIFSLTPGYFDKEAKYTAYKEKEGFIRTFSLGLAFELGLNDWITGAVQWTPGLAVWGSVDRTGFDKATVFGLADLFVGAKFLVVGEKAPVPNKQLRFAVAPGVKIPMPGPDWKAETDNFNAGKNFIVSDADKHALAFGARFFFDYVVNEAFFVNLYNETLFYLPVEKAALLSGGTGSTKIKFEYGYSTTFELEPRFLMQLGTGVRFFAGLPIALSLAPSVKKDGVDQKDASTSLSLGPKLNLFLTSIALPLEIELTYMIPVYGKADEGTGTPESVSASHALILLFRPYLKLF